MHGNTPGFILKENYPDKSTFSDTSFFLVLNTRFGIRPMLFWFIDNG
jgi:hypothetical protein